jgi:hypothetical protein
MLDLVYVRVRGCEVSLESFRKPQGESEGKHTQGQCRVKGILSSLAFEAKTTGLVDAEKDSTDFNADAFFARFSP